MAHTDIQASGAERVAQLVDVEIEPTVGRVDVRHHPHHIEVRPAIQRTVPVGRTCKDMRKFVGRRSNGQL